MTSSLICMYYLVARRPLHLHLPPHSNLATNTNCLPIPIPAIIASLTLLRRYTEDTATKPEPVEVKPEPPAPVEVKAEEPANHEEQNGQADTQNYGAGEEMDEDDIDINLGNGNSYDSPANGYDAHGPGIKEDG